LLTDSVGRLLLIIETFGRHFLQIVLRNCSIWTA